MSLLRRPSRTTLLGVGVVTLLALGASLSPAGPVSAATSAVSQTGRVVDVDDGDTIRVDIANDGTSTPLRIRLTGINAMEMTHGGPPEQQRGECHAVAATRRLTALIEDKKVKITAQRASSMSGSRYRRTVWVYRDGAWRDVAQIMLREGHGLFLSHQEEYATNKGAATAAQYAASRRVNLWDKDYCGSGPYQAAALRVAVKWDADGNDQTNINGEWIRVANDSSYAVPIGGWRVRDSAYRGTLARGYVFPAGAKIGARSYVVVHVGKGTRTARHFYWGLSEPIFENASASPKYIGDGGYLFDPQGDLRAWHQYPCRYRC